MNDSIERRYYNVPELRMTVDADRRPIIEGHAAVFNQPSLEIFGVAGWREVIKPGAFSKAIKSDDVRALINHNDDKLIGRVSNGTLFLEEDEIGLRVRIFPPDTTDTKDLLTLIRGKYISQMSFGFRIGPDGHRIDETNKLREILEVSHLYDVSPVTEPAYPQTDVGLRSFLAGMSAGQQTEDEFQKRKEEQEKFLKSHAPEVDPLSLKAIWQRFKS